MNPKPMERGNSFANGQAMSNGLGSPWTWQGGYEAPRPVTHYDHTEGRIPE